MMWLPRYPKIGEYIYYSYTNMYSICKVMRKHGNSNRLFEIEVIYEHGGNHEDWSMIAVSIKESQYGNVKYKFFSEEKKAIAYAVMERL